MILPHKNLPQLLLPLRINITCTGGPCGAPPTPIDINFDKVSLHWKRPYHYHYHPTHIVALILPFTRA